MQTHIRSSFRTPGPSSGCQCDGCLSLDANVHTSDSCPLALKLIFSLSTRKYADALDNTSRMARPLPWKLEYDPKWNYDGYCPDAGASPMPTMTSAHTKDLDADAVLDKMRYQRSFVLESVVLEFSVQLRAALESLPNRSLSVVPTHRIHHNVMKKPYRTLAILSRNCMDFTAICQLAVLSMVTSIPASLKYPSCSCTK